MYNCIHCMTCVKNQICLCNVKSVFFGGGVLRFGLEEVYNSSLKNIYPLSRVIFDRKRYLFLGILLQIYTYLSNF